MWTDDEDRLVRVPSESSDEEISLQVRDRYVREALERPRHELEILENEQAKP